MYEQNCWTWCCLLWCTENMRWSYNRHEVVPASRLPPLTLYPKRSFSLGDFRCVAPALILIKHIEKLVNQHIKASVPTSQDPHQSFAVTSTPSSDPLKISPSMSRHSLLISLQLALWNSGTECPILLLGSGNVTGCCNWVPLNTVSKQCCIVDCNSQPYDPTKNESMLRCCECRTDGEVWLHLVFFLFFSHFWVVVIY